MGPGDLASILANFPNSEDPNLLVGFDHADDAGVYRLSDDLALIQSVDFFTPIVDDPYDYGQIAAANALSDIYAMGGKPLTAVNLLAYPTAKLSASVVERILLGGADKLREAGAALLGGHTVEDTEPKYGMCVTGTVHPNRIITNGKARPGDVLVLTKALGTGIIVTALKAEAAPEGALAAAIRSMKRLNRDASACMLEFGVTACTDITGYGLLGHAMELATASGLDLEIEAEAVPLLPAVLELIDSGFITGGGEGTRAFLTDKVKAATSVTTELLDVLFDPQTSGGLLIAVPPDKATSLVDYLHCNGDEAAAVVGRALPSQQRRIVVT